MEHREWTCWTKTCSNFELTLKCTGFICTFDRHLLRFSFSLRSDEDEGPSLKHTEKH